MVERRTQTCAIHLPHRLVTCSKKFAYCSYIIIKILLMVDDFRRCALSGCVHHVVIYGKRTTKKTVDFKYLDKFREIDYNRTVQPKGRRSA